MALLKDLKPTGRKGVFFKKHDTRKNGVKKDQLWVLRYTIGGKTRTEVFGWASDGLTEIDAEQKIATFRANFKAGSGPVSLAEEQEHRKKEIENNQAAEKLAEIERKKRETTIANYWVNFYLPHIKEVKKTQSWKTERSLFDHWIEPTIGSLKIIDLTPLHLRRMKKKMTAAEKSPATIRLAYFVVQQLWNLAVSDGYAEGRSPTKDTQAGMPKKKTLNNERERYLTAEEADKLLVALKEKSTRLHDIALLSLHTGMRAAEVFSLTWDCINLDRGTVRLLDTKTRSPRTVPLTETASEMLKNRKQNAQTQLEKMDTSDQRAKALKEAVFPAREGKTSQWVSKAFRDVVKDLKLNDGITDRRKRVCFHTLRHSAASFLVQNHVPIYTVAKILGHSSLDMTKRYAHLDDGHIRQSIATLDNALNKSTDQLDKQEQKQ